ncbi:MAG: hypothetical protein FWC32_09345, partial [Firmicutes bacterium]|nr:hypothetical protein [Bacillota bacterium]
MTDRQYFFRTFRYVRPYMVFYVIGIFIYSAQAFFGPFINAIFMGRVMEGILAMDFSIVISAVVFIVTVMVSYMVIMGIGVYIYVVVIALGIRNMSLHLFRAFMKSSIENQKHSGEGIAALNTDITTASGIFTDALNAFLNPLIAIVLASITVFIIDWRMGIGSLIVG